jgi:hypothetical protein
VTIFVENQLIQLITENIEDIDSVDRLKLSYDGRVNLAIAVGLTARLHTPLQALGQIRNKFAHQLNVQLGESEVNNFYKSFSAEDRTTIENSYQRTRKKSDTKYPSKFSSQVPLDRFVFCAVVLRAGIITARAQASQRNAAIARFLQQASIAIEK